MIAALLALIPGALSVLQWFYKAKADVELAKINGRTAVGSAAVNAAAQEADGRARTWGIIGGNQLLVLLVIFLAVPIGIWEWKELVVDKVIGPGCIWFTTACWVGHTDSLNEQPIIDLVKVIIGSIFGASSVLAVAQLWWTTKD